MQENIYAAPEASLTSPDENPVEPAFYIVSPAKMLTLYFLTFGMYSLYWHFKNWRQYKIFYNDNSPMPIMRAIFSIFFTHALFSVVDMRIKENKREFPWWPALWATIAVIALLAARIIDRVTAEGTFSEPIEFVPLALMALYGFVLLKAQRAINIACNDPQGKSNSNFTLLNCVWIFLGSILLSLAVIGILFGE